MSDKGNNYKVEFENLSDGSLEIRYFDDYRDLSYRSWRVPKTVAEELTSWWERLRNKNVNFPIKEKAKMCEINMYTEKYIDIKELDSLGRFKMVGWSFPKAVVEELVNWDKKDK